MSFLTDKIELSIEEAELKTQKSLNTFPKPLKWILLISILAIIPAYFIAKNISYKTWMSRYSQGTLTAKPSFTEPKDLGVSAITLTTLGQGTYAAVVKVNNENLDLSANQVPYEFNFYNEKKETVYTETGKLFLLPNQTKYIVVPRFTTSEKITYTNFLIPKETLKWQKKLKIPEVSIITSAPNRYQQDSPQAFVVEGDYTNQSPYTLSQVRLTFVLFDSSQKIIGVSQRDDFTVLPFERRAYKQIWPNLLGTNVDSVKVVTDTNTLDPNNLSLSSLTQDPSSSLTRPSSGPNYNP